MNFVDGLKKLIDKGILINIPKDSLKGIKNIYKTAGELWSDPIDRLQITTLLGMRVRLNNKREFKDKVIIALRTLQEQAIKADNENKLKEKAATTPTPQPRQP